MISHHFISEKFGFLGKDFLVEFEQHAIFSQMKAKTEIVREGQKNKFVPFLIKGCIRVYSLNDGRELIYYYIRPNESCLMTFSSIFSDLISRIYAVTEVDCEIILIPVSTLQEWLLKFPQINRLFYSEYEKRFIDVMQMVNDAVFHKLDKRILNYVRQQIFVTKQNPVKITHKEIANNLGTSREVVSRVLKKKENEGEILQTREGITLLS